MQEYECVRIVASDPIHVGELERGFEMYVLDAQAWVLGVLETGSPRRYGAVALDTPSLVDAQEIINVIKETRDANIPLLFYWTDDVEFHKQEASIIAGAIFDCEEGVGVTMWLQFSDSPYLPADDILE